MKAPDQTSSFDGITLQDKYVLQEGVAFMSGMQALVRLPLTLHERSKRAGLKVGGYISGYRGSPLGTYDIALEAARDQLQARSIKFQPGVNEELAATAVWGSQQTHLLGQTDFAGVFGIWYGKAPGVDRSIDVFRHGNNAGTTAHGGVLAIAGDDPNAVSSTVTGCSDYNFVSAGMPLVYPSSVQEMLDFGVLGIELSRYSGCWVGMKVVTDIGESSAILDVDVDRVKIDWPQEPAQAADVHIRWPDNRVEQEQRLYDIKHARAKAFARFSGINEVSGQTSAAARFGIISAGKPWADLQQALTDLGVGEDQLLAGGFRLLKLGMIYPLSDDQIREFSQGLTTILVIEEKRGFIEDQVKSILFEQADRPIVLGKHDSDGQVLVPSHGETSPALVAQALTRVFQDLMHGAKAQARLTQIHERQQLLSGREALAARTPYFCSGCPHNSSTKVPAGSLALGGIGCHWLALFMDRGTETFTQMGGEGAPWLGAMDFCNRQHVFANLGDGTYHHSGALAIRAAVYGGANITYKILYNDAVAMTGGQLISDTFTPQQIARQVLAEGVREVVVVTDQPEKYEPLGANGGYPEGVKIHHRDELDEVQRRLSQTAGVTVLLYDQTCAAEKRRRRKRGKMVDPDVRAFINDLVCEGCGDCSEQSNCISVEPLETVWGRKRQINQSACNKDLRCVDGFCPSFVTVTGASVKKTVTQSAEKPALAIELPEPVRAPLSLVHETVITGIGGTGVITIGALMAMAARLEGKRATCLDQTGISQKNGAVLSHVRIGEDASALHAPRVAMASADLVLGCDMMVAAGVPAVSTMSPDRTHVVLNSHLAPHAEFVMHPVTAEFGASSLKSAIEQAVGPNSVATLPATELATWVFGDAIAANMIVMGYALQMGWLPVSVQAIVRAIELNGVAIKTNLAALELGRQAAVDLDRVIKYFSPTQTIKVLSRPKESVDEMVNRCAGELAQYQNARYSKRYVDLIAHVREAERRVNPDSDQLTRVVARQAYRAMAYKDEYEVARLYSDGRFKQQLSQQFDGDTSLTFHLAPPLLAKRDPVTGHMKKKAYGSWVLPVFGLLARLKWLRGTSLDPFARNPERQLERSIAKLYPDLIEGVIGNLSADNIQWAIEIAGVFDKIRGFGHVKDRNVLQAAARLESLAAGTPVQTLVSRFIEQLPAIKQGGLAFQES